MTTTFNVQTNQLDYAPGETVYITASGLGIGAQVRFKILNLGVDGKLGGGDDVWYQPPWDVTDGQPGDTIALDGTIGTWWYVPQDALDRNLILYAQAGDQTAEYAFSDAAGSINKVYQHWSDEPLPGDWNNNILSANKSNYFEHEVIPHVFVYKASNQEPLTNGQSYSINVTYNYYQQNTNAGGFTYMTTYNLSRDPGPLNATNPYITPTLDGSFTNGGGMQGAFYTVDADITSVSNVTYLGTTTKDGYVTITFTYTGTTTKDGIAEIYYGLHISAPGQVPNQGSGPTKGASAWTGGSLQTTVDIGGSGATSIQLNPDAILVASISGYKFNDLDGDGIWDKSDPPQPSDEPTLAGWTIVLDKDSDPNNGNLGTTLTDANGFYSFSSINPDADPLTPADDPYYVYEVQQAGWKQTAPAAPGYYGPLAITAANPAYSNQNFGNFFSKPSISLDKSAVIFSDADTTPEKGDVIRYTFVVTNTGNVPLTSVTIDDTAFDLPGTIADIDVGTLAAGASKTYVRDYTLTQADVDDIFDDQDYKVDNTAQAKGSYDGKAYTADDSAFVNFEPGSLAAQISLVKEGSYKDEDGNGLDPGDTLNYTFLVTNTGAVTITSVDITEDSADLAITVAESNITLAPGESYTFHGSHTLTQPDIDAIYLDNDIDNVGRATGQDPNGEDVTATDPAKITLTPKASISISKVTVDSGTEGDGLNILAGETIGWKYTVTNTGEVTLSDVSVTDDQGVTVTAPKTTLAPGESMVATASGTAATGNYANTGTASAKSPSNSAVKASDSSSYFGANPQIAIEKRTLDGTTDAANVATAFSTKAGDNKAILSGETVTWIYAISKDAAGNVDLSNVSVTDSESGVTPTLLAKVGGDTDSILENGETWYYTATGTAGTTSYNNTGTAKGSYKDSAGHTGTDTATDASSYLGANPKIDVEKYVSVDGKAANDPTKVWLDADSTTGPTLVNTGGIQPMFKFVVVNTGNVDLANVTLTDNKFDIGGTTGDKTIEIGALPKGDGLPGDSDTKEYIFTAPWQAGQHSNTATATGAFTDDASHTRTTTDTDAAHYYGILPGLVTNSSLCTFGDFFKLLFTPDFKEGSGNYKMFSSTPGQFYYNVFYQGTGASTPNNPDDDAADFTFTIPYPFQTQGAVPVHVYSGVTIVEKDGQICLTPGTEIASRKLVDLLSTLVDADSIPGPSIGDYYQYTIKDVPTMDFVYINMHLDFGLEKQTGWAKSSSGDGAIDNGNVAGTQVAIPEPSEFAFSAAADSSALAGSKDSIFNDNVWKNIKGEGGFVIGDKNLPVTPDPDEVPLAGQRLFLTDSNGNRVVSGKVEVPMAVTDEDGWYLFEFNATGKATDYRVYWDADRDGLEAKGNGADPYWLMQMGGSAGKWVQGDLTIIDKLPLDGVFNTSDTMVWTVN